MLKLGGHGFHEFTLTAETGVLTANGHEFTRKDETSDLTTDDTDDTDSLAAKERKGTQSF